MKPNRIAIISALWLICFISYSQDFNEMLKVVAFDRAIEDNFGWSVSISGNYAIVGTYAEDEDAGGGNTLDYAGSAYIYERDYLGNWNQVQKIVNSDRAIADCFGFSVCISGSYCIVGAPYEDEDVSGSNTLDEAGSAYIFERDGAGNWNQVQKIVASDREEHDNFGDVICISGNYVVVGAFPEDEDALGGNTLDMAGSAYVFERDENGIWQQVQKLVASDRATNDRFGCSVSVSDNYIVIGAYWEDEDVQGSNTKNTAGSAYIFERDDNGDWNEVQKIVASDRNINDYFGYSVSISGDHIVVGAYLEDEDASGGNTLSNAGSAYIFERDGSGTWNEVQKIVASDRFVDDYFGHSANISGNQILVGVSHDDEDAQGENSLTDAGSAYIFELDASDHWNENQKIVASDRDVEDFFGSSVSISGDYVIVGAYFEDEDVAGGNTLDASGSVYIFESCTADPASDPRNIIENEGFETCVFNPWVLYNEWSLNALATYQLIDGICIVTPSHLAVSPEIWHIQLLQPFSATQLAKLEAGEIYNLRFDAWSEEDNTVCSVFLGMDEEPWTSDLDDLIILSTTKENYSFDFTLHEVYSSIKLAFSTGTETAWVGFDNVKLMKKSAVGIEEEEIHCIKIWPNPATDYLKIMTDNGSGVRLYNSLGVLVKEVDLRVGEGYIDVSGLAKGVYLVEIKQNANTRVEKIIVE